MLRVLSAESVPSAAIFVNTFYFGYFRNQDAAGLGNDQSLNLGLTYGLTNDLEITALFKPHQDDQQYNWFSPGDTEIGIKWQLPFSGSDFISGVKGFLSLPTARTHNPPFEPYSSPQIAWGVVGLLTLDLTHKLPRLPLKIYTNVGYLDHDITSVFAERSTDQLLLGLGFKIPVYPFILYTEYTGEIFYNHDQVGFRDNSMRLTQGFKFVGLFNTVVDIGFEVDLSRNRAVYPAAIVHDYADWKLFGGVTYRFKRKNFDAGRPGVVKIDRKKEEKILEQIRARREKANEDLEKVREQLEKKPPPKKKKQN
ncbi:MAG: hypothetical protein ACE5HS_08105 [bacterium]